MPDAQRLLEVYRKHPCRTLPNAFWKTAMQLDLGSLDIQHTAEGELKSLAVWQDGQCLAFWDAYPLEATLPPAKIDQLKLALVHDGSLAVFSDLSFKHRKPFFRLRHIGPVKSIPCPSGYLIRNARPEAEVEVVSRVIERCYLNINVDPETVRGWLAHPVYDPDLWVWVIEAKTAQKVGLGIAEFDPDVPEVSLEWIQVLPEYQRRGLGSVIVTELLNRADEKAQIITVSGELDNPNDPERHYRMCGFTGSDIWWLLSN